MDPSFFVYICTAVLWGELRMWGILAAVCLLDFLKLCVSITAVATMLQGATTIYWTVMVLQERRVAAVLVFNALAVQCSFNMLWACVYVCRNASFCTSCGSRGGPGQPALDECVCMCIQHSLLGGSGCVQLAGINLLEAPEGWPHSHGFRLNLATLWLPCPFHTLSSYHSFNHMHPGTSLPLF